MVLEVLSHVQLVFHESIYLIPVNGVHCVKLITIIAGLGDIKEDSIAASHILMVLAGKSNRNSVKEAIDIFLHVLNK